MARGPGKYGPLLKIVLDVAKADQGFLIVLDGSKGPGAAMTCSPKNYERMISFLLDVVKDLRVDLDAHLLEQAKKAPDEATH